MNSSSPAPERSPADASAHADSRFIPREELKGFTSWRPDAFGPAGEPKRRAADALGEVQAARQAGYQDGYRDGLAALEHFKASFARQTVAQVGTLVQAFDAEFTALESNIAETVCAAAVALARQVVRSELATRPELVAAVATQAVDALLLSARHVRVLVHPADLALVEQGAADALASRGARLLGDAAITRGGCRVESDLGRIDATVEARWAQAAAALGQLLPLDEPPR